MIILLKKLNRVSIGGAVLNLFSSHSTNDFNMSNDIESSRVPMTINVPQGSVLEPLLFLICIVDRYYLALKSNPYLFADV